MKKILLLSCLMFVCVLLVSTQHIQAKDYPMFDLRDGNGPVYADEFFNYDSPTKEGYTFGGWSTYLDGIGASRDNAYVSKGANNVYDESDFKVIEDTSIYYAIWLNEYGNAVMFVGYDDTNNNQIITLYEEEDINSELNGFTWNHSTDTLTFNNITVKYLNDPTRNSSFFDAYGDVNLVINGTNTIGNNVSFDDMNYEGYMEVGNCLVAGMSANNFIISGNGSLNIYDYVYGIKADENIEFTEDFSGTITIYDKGDKLPSPPPMCCLRADNDIIINNGIFNLYNDLTNAINAGGNLTINGGKIKTQSNNQAISVSEKFSIPTTYKIVANDKYDGTGNNVEVTNASGVITNYSTAKYVRIEKPYTVTYDSNNATSGTTPEDTNKYFEGETAQLKTQGTLVKDNYKFLGWNTDKDATTALSFEDNEYTMGNEDVTFYAIWEENYINVTVSAENKTMYLGDNLPTFTAKVEGLVGTDTIDYSFREIEVNAIGAYSIVPIGETIQGSYKITYVQGILAVSAKDDKPNVNLNDVSRILDKYRNNENYNNKILDVVVRTSDSVPQTDKELISKELASDNKAIYIDTKLYLIISDGTSTQEKDIGDENDELISVTYSFDFSKKKDIQVFRVHNNEVDEITETANDDGEYYKIDKNKGNITITAKKYSTFAFAYKDVTDGTNYVVVNTGVDSNSNPTLKLISLISLLTVVVTSIKKKH